MPQVQDQNQFNQPQAETIRQDKIFRDRLRDRYKPLDNVRVINVDNETFEWQYFPIDAEEETFDDNGAVRLISGRRRFTNTYDGAIPGAEQIWELGPGDSEVLIGANADLFIEGLYKRCVAKQKISETPLTDEQIKQGRVRSMNWTDGLQQERWIDRIFLGVVKPNFDEPVRTISEPTPEPSRGPGRPAKAQ